MKTLLVSFAGSAPGELRDWLRQGSTSVATATGPDAGHAVDPDVDRVVLWSDEGGTLPRGLDAVDPRRIFYVSPARGTEPSGVTADQIFVWPQDREKLRMVLTVGNG